MSLMIINPYRFAAGGGPVTTLDPLNIGPFITLSNGNLTATHNSALINWNSVRGTTFRSSGKYYFEARLDYSAGSFVAAGVGNTSQTLANYVGSGINGIGLISNGDVFQNATPTTAVSGFSTGGIGGLAVDIDNRKLWVRNGAGAWNSARGGTQDPATNQGGITFPSGLSTGDVYVFVSVQALTDAVTANFGATAFANSPPSGFTAWT